jgi:excisionase family DNA binding protein
MPKLCTAKEIGEYLKLTESTIYKLVANGDIPGFKIGKSWRFDMEAIVEKTKESQKKNGRQNGRG